MYIISLVLAIIACITAFLPLYGAIFAVLLGMISMVISIINIKSADKKIKEISIISIIVCIFSVIICVCINLYSFFLKPSNPYVEDVSFTTLSQDYPTYNINNQVDNDKLKFKINDYNIENNAIYINYTMTFYGEKSSFSAFDFYILDESTDDIYYITYENGPEYVYNSILGNDESISGKMKFVLNDNYNIDNLYLVYKNEKSNFKIKI